MQAKVRLSSTQYVLKSYDNSQNQLRIKRYVLNECISRQIFAQNLAFWRLLGFNR